GRRPDLDDTQERFCGSYRAWGADGTLLRPDETPMVTALRDGTLTENGEVTLERPDGSRVTVLVNISPLRAEDGRITGAINVFHETSPQRASEQARAHLAAIVESSDDAIISKDLRGIITTWNRGAERLFGYLAEEAIGQSVLMLIPPHLQGEEPRILARISRGDRIEHYETVRQRKDGRLIDISLSVSPIRNRDGRVVGASKIARDITDRKQAEAERDRLLRLAEAARHEAEQASRAKDEFLAMLGHELRNPLAAIRSAVTAAALDTASRERALEIARRQTDQLGRIVDDLLDVARITHGHIRLRRERLAVGDVIRRAVEAARGFLDDRGHTLTLSLPAEPVYFEVDPARFEQVLSNLLSNAAKYTAPGGEIAITAARDGRDVVIRVRDNGMGIPADVLPRIFDVFTQGERTLDRTMGGLGLGLTLVRRIIELHGGGVTASSSGTGHGAEFEIRVPATAAPAATPAAPAPASSVPGHGRSLRVLIVEDNRDAGESLRMVVDLLGHQARLVADGPAALDAITAMPPDLMLVDIGLPGMSGYELGRAVRQLQGGHGIQLAAVTGYGSPDDRARVLAAGFDRHLVKPVDVELLKQILASFGSAPSPSGT
ncbi:MAG: PAS domain S-box protein, partial [Vicinamibacterales bacterium]